MRDELRESYLRFFVPWIMTDMYLIWKKKREKKKQKAKKKKREKKKKNKTKKKKKECKDMFVSHILLHRFFVVGFIIGGFE